MSYLLTIYYVIFCYIFMNEYDDDGDDDDDDER